MVPRVTAAKKPWKRRPLGRKKADDGIKEKGSREAQTLVKSKKKKQHARGEFDTISYG